MLREMAKDCRRFQGGINKWFVAGEQRREKRLGDSQVVISGRGALRLRGGHPWVYRSDVVRAQAAAGDVVRVLDERGKFLGRAFFSDRSQISVRLVSGEDRPIDRAFLRGRIRTALDYRARVVEDTDSYRLVHGEADGLPSVIVDRYADCLVVQTLSQASDRLLPEIVSTLEELCSPAAIVERNDPKVRLLEGLEQRVSVISGKLPEEAISTINGVKFGFQLLTGQKTGGFLDQRENRKEAARYARGEALDCFCYMGGFALTIAGKCSSVEAIDLSPQAIQAARHNQEINGIKNVAFREANVFDALKSYGEKERRFDTIILDPPAFAKNRDSLQAARRGYKEINLRALKLLRPGGLLVTCSCSHHVSEVMFLEMLGEAAKDVHRRVTIFERRTQARDHPVILGITETGYLKCILAIIVSI
jgi:23S rRNA (cytosine1962-C5)-methyltransferase